MFDGPRSRINLISGPGGLRLLRHSETSAHGITERIKMFLTREDQERLGVTSYIGTNELRAYMHGFFVHYKLYRRAQSSVDPFAYEDYQEKRKQEKMVQSVLLELR